MQKVKHYLTKLKKSFSNSCSIIKIKKERMIQSQIQKV